MPDEDEAPPPGRAGRADDLADVLGRLGVDPWTPADVDWTPLLASDVFADPTPDPAATGR